MVFEIYQLKMTLNIPYITLFGIAFAFLIMFLISVYRRYWFHGFLYIIGFVCVMLIFSKKENFDMNQSKLVDMESFRSRMKA